MFVKSLASYLKVINRKILLSSLISYFFVFCSLQPVAAQQQTGSAQPQTRNPQTQSVELFQQQTDVQTTGSQQVLNQPTTIRIPSGQPANNDQDLAEDQDVPKPPWMLIVLLSILLIVAGFVTANRRKWNKPTATAGDAPIVETRLVAESPRPIQIAKSHNKTTKKKSRAKRKKRR